MRYLHRLLQGRPSALTTNPETLPPKDAISRTSRLQCDPTFKSPNSLHTQLISGMARVASKSHVQFLRNPAGLGSRCQLTHAEMPPDPAIVGGDNENWVGPCESTRMTASDEKTRRDWHRQDAREVIKAQPPILVYNSLQRQERSGGLDPLSRTTPRVPAWTPCTEPTAIAFRVPLSHQIDH